MAAYNSILGHIRAGDAIDRVEHVAIADFKAVLSGTWAAHVNSAVYM